MSLTHPCTDAMSHELVAMTSFPLCSTIAAAKYTGIRGGSERKKS